MPYLRHTADRRGVEHTFLVHVAAPGERPKVLYWYRTVPGVKVGRPALDDEAMRALEEQYPDIDFDWPYILDLGSMTPVEVEAPLPPRRRKTAPAPRAERTDETSREAASADPGPAAEPESSGPPEDAGEMGPDLLSELLGRGIAASLRDQHGELSARIDAATAEPDRVAGWRERLGQLDPDTWTTPDEVLAGMTTIDRDLDRLRAELDALGGDH